MVAVGPGPVDVARLGHAVHLLDGGRVHEDGHHEQRGRGPRRQRDDPRDDVRPELGRRYRVAHGNVAVGRHDREKDGAGELVDGGRGHVDLAHGHAEYPLLVPRRHH